MSCAAIVVAAGEGRRFGSGRPKQFQPLAGRPVAVHACQLMTRHPGVDGVVLVLPASTLEEPPEWLARLPPSVRTVAGGTSRTASVRRGSRQVPSGTKTVLVHDGVRPLATPDLVNRVRAAAGEGPCIPVVPVVDTVKRVDGAGRVVETVDRSALRLVQTPQGFPADVLERVLERSRREGRDATDEAGLCEEYGITVRTVEGELENLKITRPGDLALAEMLLQRRTSADGTGRD